MIPINACFIAKAKPGSRCAVHDKPAVVSLLRRGVTYHLKSGDYHDDILEASFCGACLTTMIGLYNEEQERRIQKASTIRPTPI